MKNTTLILICLSAFFATFAQTEEASARRKTVPVVNLKDIYGNGVSTSTIDNGGKPIIIDFWATWCKPCIRELSAIADVYDDWVKETGVKLYAISVDDPRSSSQVKPFVDGKGWSYTILLDQNSDLKRAMGVGPIPQTFVLNGKGEIIWTHTTFAEGNENDIIEVIRKVVKGEEIK
ncbi:MAG: TlpA disulfide reductase family protein [Bacteroidetes bacterium]|nr:TlpA disulfide reductase family protein [Bacteroidota bacterium]